MASLCGHCMGPRSWRGQCVDCEAIAEANAIRRRLPERDGPSAKPTPKQTGMWPAVKINGKVIMGGRPRVVPTHLIQRSHPRAWAQAMDRMEDRQRTAFVAIFVEGKKLTDLARELGIKKSAAKQLADRAARVLVECGTPAPMRAADYQRELQRMNAWDNNASTRSPRRRRRRQTAISRK